ncbi:MAG: hypothetical protein CMH63_00150 [Nanoarchaeota archaeon]|jgi:hypothetical protein|nr:hypothetical protein [Nanoarchaeota archaeon]|tara:strand:- start:43199 stop:43495 length:297 start_codon:yes stop_codon:yes gene_type:complete
MSKQRSHQREPSEGFQLDSKVIAYIRRELDRTKGGNGIVDTNKLSGEVCGLYNNLEQSRLPQGVLLKDVVVENIRKIAEERGARKRGNQYYQFGEERG